MPGARTRLFADAKNVIRFEAASVYAAPQDEFKLRRKEAPEETLHSEPRELQSDTHRESEPPEDENRHDLHRGDQRPEEQHDEEQDDIAVNPQRAQVIAGFSERLKAEQGRSKRESEREVKPEAAIRTRKEFAPSSPQLTDSPRSCDTARRSLERPLSTHTQALPHAEAPSDAIADFMQALKRLSRSITSGDVTASNARTTASDTCGLDGALS